MITFLLTFAYVYVFLLVLCTSIAIFGTKLGNGNNKLAQKLYDGGVFLNFLVFRFFINEKPDSFKERWSVFMRELSGKIALPVIFITVDNMKSPSVLRSSLTVILFLLIYILIFHKYTKIKNKDLFHIMFMALPLLIFIITMIQSVLENKENTPHTWLFIWVALTMLLILTLNIMSINAVLYFFEDHPYIKLIFYVLIIFITLVLISWIFGSCYARYASYFNFSTEELKLMKKTGWNDPTVLFFLFYKGITPFWGNFYINTEHAQECIAYLPSFEKMIGYIYPPIFIVLLINGKIREEEKDKKCSKQT